MLEGLDRANVELLECLLCPFELLACSCRNSGRWFGRGRLVPRADLLFSGSNDPLQLESFVGLRAFDDLGTKHLKSDVFCGLEPISADPEFALQASLLERFAMLRRDAPVDRELDTRLVAG